MIGNTKTTHRDEIVSLGEKTGAGKEEERRRYGWKLLFWLLTAARRAEFHLRWPFKSQALDLPGAGTGKRSSLYILDEVRAGSTQREAQA